MPRAGVHVMSSRFHTGTSLLAAVTGGAGCWRLSSYLISSHRVQGFGAFPSRVFIVKSEVVVLCVSMIRSASMPLVEGSWL